MTVIKNWWYRRQGHPEWKKARDDTHGNQIHLDLIKNGEIPDPFVDDNEKKVQWVGKVDWEYKTDLGASARDRTVVFEGLDTFGEVYVDGELKLVTDNMFVEYRLAIPSTPIELKIIFRNALHESRKLEQKHGGFYCSNGESSRVHVRKAQYHYGWDWGPLLLTCGPWRPARVEEDLVELANLKIDYHFEAGQVELKFEADILNNDDFEMVFRDTKVQVIVNDGDTSYECITAVEQSGVNAVGTIYIENPKLWWPINYGGQFLYDVQANLIENNRMISQCKRKLGVRKAQLVQTKLEKGKTFYFEINDTPIFINGCNWIPSHSFHSDTTKAHYEEWIKLIKNANFNLIRVWGGGIWEPDWFYELCDYHGILIWHDFMFACAMYPAYDSFLNNVKLEVKQQLTRLQKFTSIIIYAGNNEDYQIAEQLGKVKFPAQIIYEKILPRMVDEIIGDKVAYHWGCPYSPSDGEYIPTSDPTVGDIHQWNVWHGTQEKYQDWDKLIGRFILEFGMLAFANHQTLQRYITKLQYPQLQMMDLHNKAVGFERRLALYVMENVKVDAMDLENWIYLTQLIQSECLSMAYRYWKRKWQNHECGGGIVWQINDCYPVNSWSIVDFAKRPKLAYYSIKRECQPIIGGLKRDSSKINQDYDEPDDLSEQLPLHDFTPRLYEIDAWIGNFTQLTRIIEYRIDIHNKFTLRKSFKNEVSVNANTTKEFLNNYKLQDWNDLVVLTIFENGVQIHQTSDWPQPLKYIEWPTTHIASRVKQVGPKKYEMTLTTDQPVKGVMIQIQDSSHQITDNGFDLFPYQSHQVIVYDNRPFTYGIKYLK